VVFRGRTHITGDQSTLGGASPRCFFAAVALGGQGFGGRDRRGWLCKRRCRGCYGGVLREPAGHGPVLVATRSLLAVFLMVSVLITSLAGLRRGPRWPS